MRFSLPLRNDYEGEKPRFYAIAAKAGSGKTETLARAYIAVLLRELMGKEGNRSSTPLRELAAVTFTREAAREMRARIFCLLKSAACGDERVLSELKVALEEYSGVSGSNGDLKELCARAMEEILTHYSSFSVGTLDQFFVQLFFALSPVPFAKQELELVLSPESLQDRGKFLFEEHLARLGEEGNLLFNLAQGYREKLNWDPLSSLFTDSLKAYNFFSPHPPRFRFREEELSLAAPGEGAFALLVRREERLRALQDSILSYFSNIREIVPAEVFTPHFANLLQDLKNAKDPRVFKELLENRKLKQEMFKKKESAALPFSLKKEVEELRNRAVEEVVHYLELERASGLFYYWLLYRIVLSAYQKLFHEEGTILLSLLQQLLALTYEGEEGIRGIPPEFVLSRGSTLRYLFIDEFQDTSPLQWYLLRPIVSELLSGGKPGILFLVGDTRQSLYSFRGSDWKLMAALKPGAEKGTPFPSAQGIVKEPRENFRSLPKILAFVQEVFTEENLIRFLQVCEKKGKNEAKITPPLLAAILAELRKAGLTEVQQVCAKVGSHSYQGLVEVYGYEERQGDAGRGEERAEESDREEHGSDPLKTPLANLLAEILHYLLVVKGRNPNDIAILCERNDEVVQLSSLLLELARTQRLSVPFSVLSFSTLDLRKHPLVEELYLLLRYLYDDPARPLYDGYLGRFLFGEIFTRFFLRNENAKKSAGTSPPETPEELRLMLKRIFKKRKADPASPHDHQGDFYTAQLKKSFPELWEEFFEPLRIRRGFLSLYELVAEIYRTFQVFPNFSQDQEGQGLVPFIEFLEKVHRFELKEGTNCERFFRSFEEGSEEEWEVEGIRSRHAISVLTIHKAKGKDFPVVISVHPSHRSGGRKELSHEYLLEWGGDGDASGTSFLGDPQFPWITEIIPLLSEKTREYKEEWQKTFFAKKAQEYLDLLTRFYVAFTRSKEELFILCGIPEENNKKPYAFLLIGEPEARQQGEENSFFLLLRRGERIIAGIPTEEPGPAPFENTPELSSLFSSRTLKLPAAHTSPETLFGVRLHECLTTYRYSDPKSSELFKDALQKLSLKEEEIARILVVLNNGIVQGLCDPSSLLEEHCEYEIADEAGNLHRLDRVLLYPDRVQVLDFKSGAFKEEDLLQVQEYKRLLSSLYPGKRVEGYLLYLFKEGNWVVVP